MVDRTVDDTASDPVEVEVAARRPAAPSEVERGEPVSAGRPWAQRLADRIPDLLAGYLAFVAMFCAVTALYRRCARPWPGCGLQSRSISVGAPPSLATAAFLGILAAAVRRRMRAAWWFLVVYVVLGRLLTWLSVVIDTEADDTVAVTTPWGARGLATGRLRGHRARPAPPRARPVHGADRSAATAGGRSALYLGVVLAGDSPRLGPAASSSPAPCRRTGDRLGWALTYVLGGLGSPATSPASTARARGRSRSCAGCSGRWRCWPRRTCCSGRGATCAASGPDDEQRLRVPARPVRRRRLARATSPPAATRPRSSPGPASRR